MLRSDGLYSFRATVFTVFTRLPLAHRFMYLAWIPRVCQASKSHGALSAIERRTWA